VRADDRVDGLGIKRALVLLIVLLLAFPLLRAESRADEAPRRVLILHSYNYTFPATAAVSEALRKALAEFLRTQARMIRESYVSPPFTTDFAILFVPTEGLYAEMMARAGFAEMLQREFRVTLTGPTNFLALLNSLQMGFRTLAIQERSSEVWKILGAVKSEFRKFGEVLDGVKKKLDQASSTMDDAAKRSRAIERKLREVEQLPAAEAQLVLAGVSTDAEELEEAV
jgi:DNA recombination protein RmuC